MATSLDEKPSEKQVRAMMASLHDKLQSKYGNSDAIAMMVESLKLDVRRKTDGDDVLRLVGGFRERDGRPAQAPRRYAHGRAASVSLPRLQCVSESVVPLSRGSLREGCPLPPPLSCAQITLCRRCTTIWRRR